MLKSKNFNRVISMLLALALWAYVIGNQNPLKYKDIVDIPLQLLNEENLAARGLAISGDVDLSVNVRVQGRPNEVSKLTSGDFTASADLLFGYIGKNYIPVTVNSPDGLQQVEIRPNNKIVVNIEELVVVPKPVKVFFVGKFADGIEAGRIITLPDQVEVSGAKSEVEAVSYIKAEINTSKLKEEANTVQVKAIPVSRSDDVVGNVKLSSSYIGVTAELLRVKEVPLQIEILGQVAPIYEVISLRTPDKVKIKGPKELIAGIEEVIALPVDISDVVSTSQLPVQMELPEGVELASGNETVSVDIAIKPIATKEFIYRADEIVIEGVEGDIGLTITTPQITVIASGSEAVISGLNKEDLVPYLSLDATELLSGTARVLVRYNKQLGHIAVDPETVHITLNQAGGE